MSAVVTEASAPSLSVRGLSRSFDDIVAVSKASFDVLPGEIFALIGPSGCGKSTTLRLLAGFETPDEGEIALGGHRIDALPPEQRGIGIVFQDYALFPHLTVLGNVSFALNAYPRAERAAAADRYIAMVGLQGLESRYPDQLSGGQQQRVALARTFAAQPKLILLDEPFSNLDASLRQATRREIRAMLKESGVGAVFVTHDQEEALSFADRVCVMRAGRIEQMGEPAEVYYRPTSAFVAGFLGRTNLIRGRASGTTAHTPLGLVDLDGPADGDVLLSIRPEHLSLASGEGQGSTARIVDREFKGHDMTYWVKAADGQYQVDTDFTCPFAPGDEVRLVVRSPATVVLDR